MNSFTNSVSKIFRGIFKAFKDFPATLICAAAFCVVTIIRIYLDWPDQISYNFTFNCLHWAFAAGAIFSLALITLARSHFHGHKSFFVANLVGFLAAALIFSLLYFFGGKTPEYSGAGSVVMRTIAISRVSIFVFISLISFIIFAGYPEDKSGFARSFFMTHKAFFIAMLYGIVILAGTTGVARAIQALLYKEMSTKVYMYITTLSGFLAFAIFVGYFPDFRKNTVDEQRETAQRQPRFVEILFEYIMVPIMLALTVVLILWAVKTIIQGMVASFVLLSGIATAYASAGLWLHIMLTHHQTGLSKFYRRAYPLAAIIILAFEAWALVIQLNKSGLQTTEYIFIVIWIVALCSSLLLLIFKSKSHRTIAVLTCVVAAIAVLPAVGYQELPVKYQIQRLEELLSGQGMFVNGEIVPAKSEPETSVKEAITNAVDYLVFADDAKLPEWFNEDYANNDIFKNKFGFDKVWPEMDDIYKGAYGEYMSTTLVLSPDALDISGYKWVVNMQDEYVKENRPVIVKADKGVYNISWSLISDNGIPVLKIKKDERVILEKDMGDYINQISGKYPPGKTEPYMSQLEDMSLKLETPEIEVMLVFRNINIGLDTKRDIIDYYLNLDSIYLREK